MIGPVAFVLNGLTFVWFKTPMGMVKGETLGWGLPCMLS